MLKGFLKTEFRFVVRFLMTAERTQGENGSLASFEANRFIKKNMIKRKPFFTQMISDAKRFVCVI